MITTFRGRTLDWYMKLFVVPVGIPEKSLDQIQSGLVDELKNPKSESQCITELKEIKQMSNEYAWDFDQRFKTLMVNVSFQIFDIQHKE